MLEVTEAATTQVAEYFKGQDPTPIRVFLNQGGWAGPGLAMALDEPRDTDEVYKVDGFTYLVDKDLLEKAKPIKIDFAITGFKIDCSIDFGSASGCSSCSTSGGCGSWSIRKNDQRKAACAEHAAFFHSPDRWKNRSHTKPRRHEERQH